MPQLEAAVPTRVISITPKLVSQKIRVAGRLLTYDTNTATLLLSDGKYAVFVDITLCLNSGQSMAWLRERNCIVIILGNLEESDAPIPLPTLPPLARVAEVDPYLVLRALLVMETPTLNLALWNRAIEEREQSIHCRPDGSSNEILRTDDTMLNL